MSSPRWRYSETEKGRGIRSDSSTSIDRPSGPKLLDAAIRAHRGAPGLATVTRWRTMGSSTLVKRTRVVARTVRRRRPVG
ncbi:hypothetical protein Bca52824_075566 [Brassica carinata]|uniref:Uncharacterized protein n=1 Tax=Brassica carinata TaxID=52824 RepID=A0A8X7PT59_BRACI|nr:hypothetical protein Bca52824_075566 [Brassica carinata]